MESNEFLAFWGWRHLPWATPPSTDQLFWQRSTLNFLQKLLTHSQRTHGLSLIVGPSGHGKSTLCRWLFQQFPTASDDVVLIPLTAIQKKQGWLATCLTRYLGIPVDSQPEVVYYKLLESRLRKRSLTIVIDQAEKITNSDAMEELQALLQSKAYGTSPINFILVGQNSLFKNSQAFDGLLHRIHFQGELQPFDSQEAGQFLHYYLKTLQLPPQTLSAEAHSLIIEQAIPTYGGIESIVEAALIEGFLRQQRIIQVDSIHEIMLKRSPAGDSEETTADSAKQTKSALRKKPTPKNVAGSAAALDLNSLYYKSDGSQDPEDS